MNFKSKTFLSLGLSLEIANNGSPWGSVDSIGNAKVPTLCVEVVNKQNYT